MPNQQNQQQMQVRVPEEISKGRYANIVRVSTTKEEFIFDFGAVHPQDATGVISDRIFMNPAHVKRMIEMLARLMEQYEKNFGTVSPAEAPREIGFEAR
ncbi:MAG: DUF3467 domain-containing protein [Parcubacteria group bacterium]|nr:DUF3467 domain-containing protein [Parcubacteria group bacterium]